MTTKELKAAYVADVRLMTDANRWRFIAFAYATPRARRTNEQICTARFGLCAAATFLGLRRFGHWQELRPKTAYVDWLGYWWPTPEHHKWTRSCDMARAKFAMQQWHRLQ